jgi:hypothetical protein
MGRIKTLRTLLPAENKHTMQSFKTVSAKKKYDATFPLLAKSVRERRPRSEPGNTTAEFDSRANIISLK